MRWPLFLNMVRFAVVFFQGGACFDAIRGVKAVTTQFLKFYPTQR